MKFDKVSNDGKRAWCPACDDSTRKQGSVQINGDYAFCHRCNEHWNFGEYKKNSVSVEYKLKNTRPLEPTEAVEKSNYDECRTNYLNNNAQILKTLKLPWNDKAMDEMLGVGIRRDDKKELQLVFRIADDHVKYHKGSQFGSAKCKVYPSPFSIGPCSTLLLCEGEKDVVTAHCHGANAVTFTSGAGAVPEDLTVLDEYNNIVIAYDNDEKGIEGARKTAIALYKTGRKVSIVEWNGQPEKYDITDYLKYNSIDELWKLAVPFGDDPVDLGGMPSFSPAQFLSTFKELPVPIVDSLLYEKDILGIAGSTNVGKSVFSLQLSTCIAMGVPFMTFNIPKPRRVMHVQFELKDEGFARLIKVTSQTLLEQCPVEAHRFEENCVFLSSGQRDLFTDKYDAIEANLRHTDVDVLVIDNLNTSVGVDVSKNEMAMEVLRKLINLKQKYNLSIIMVSHHKKIDVPAPIDISQMLGGSAYTNSLDFICQLANTKRAEGVKVMKITKVRAHSKFHNVPLALKLHNYQDESEKQKLYFDYLRPLPKNEIFWLTDPKESNEEKVLKAIASGGDNFSWEQFATALEQTMRLTSTQTAFNWIDKMITQGLIEKLERGHYRKLTTEIDDLLD